MVNGIIPVMTIDQWTRNIGLDTVTVTNNDNLLVDTVHLYTWVHLCATTWSLGQHHGIIFCKQINKMMIRWHLKVLVVKCDEILMIYRIPKSLRLMELYGWLLTNDWIYYSCNKFSILCSSRKSRSEVCRMFCFIYWSNIRFLIKQFSLSHS